MESTQKQSGVYLQEEEEEEYFMGPRYFSHSQGDAGVSFAALLEVKQNCGDFVSTCCVYAEDNFTKTGLGQTFGTYSNKEMRFSFRSISAARKSIGAGKLF